MHRQGHRQFLNHMVKAVRGDPEVQKDETHQQGNYSQQRQHTPARNAGKPHHNDYHKAENHGGTQIRLNQNQKHKRRRHAQRNPKGTPFMDNVLPPAQVVGQNHNKDQLGQL